MHPKQDSGCQPSAPAVVVDADGLPALFDALHGRGYTVAGPTVRDGANWLSQVTAGPPPALGPRGTAGT